MGTGRLFPGRLLTQTLDSAEESKIQPRDHARFLELAASESLQVHLKDDGWSASHELSTPPGCPSPCHNRLGNLDGLIQTYQQSLGKHTETRESTPVIVRTIERTSASSKIQCSQYLFIQSNLVMFPKRISLPYPDEEILSGFEEDVSSKRDGSLAWVQADLATILKSHLVNVNGANPAFREAPDRKHSTN